MAASAEPTGSQGGGGGHPSNGNGNGNAGGGGNPSNGNAGSGSGAAQGLKHDPGLSLEWSAEEQAVLDELLVKYASDQSIFLYAKIAKELPNKNVRDVAFRSRWMTTALGAQESFFNKKKKENGKRRKEDLTRKNKDKKDKVVDPSTRPPAHMVARTVVPQYALPMPPVDNDDEISCGEIGGVIGQLLEHNSHVFNQISVNLSNYQIQDNFSLLYQTRENILKMLNDVNEMAEIMKQMPQLPVKLNDDLSNSILPRCNVHMQS